jgi:hypothetical protein
MNFEPNGRGILALVITFVLPLVVGLVTKQSFSPALKAVLLLLFQAVAQFLIAWQDSFDGEPFKWQAVALSVGVGFVMSVAVHFGLWKPTGATEAVQSTLVADPPTAREPIR